MDILTHAGGTGWYCWQGVKNLRIVEFSIIFSQFRWSNCAESWGLIEYFNPGHPTQPLTRPTPFNTGPTTFYTGPTPFNTGPTTFYTGPTPFNTGPTTFYTGPTPFFTGPTTFYTGPTPFYTGPTPFYTWESLLQPLQIRISLRGFVIICNYNGAKPCMHCSTSPLHASDFDTARATRH